VKKTAFIVWIIVMSIFVMGCSSTAKSTTAMLATTTPQTMTTTPQTTTTIAAATSAITVQSTAATANATTKSTKPLTRAEMIFTGEDDLKAISPLLQGLVGWKYVPEKNFNRIYFTKNDNPKSYNDEVLFDMFVRYENFFDPTVDMTISLYKDVSSDQRAQIDDKLTAYLKLVIPTEYKTLQTKLSTYETGSWTMDGRVIQTKSKILDYNKRVFLEITIHGKTK
jgi:hypothetical protein